RGVKASAEAMPQSLFDRYVAQEQTKMRKLVESTGTENPYLLHRRMGDEMTNAVTVVREEKTMRKALAAVRDIRERFKHVKLADTSTWTNQNLSFTRALGDMIIYAEAILACAIERKESRGSHYRTDYPERDDAQFLKTTVCKY